ncbi:MAG TPA: glycosyltransferase family 2 protein [Elusimicrobiota bacterium]|nr:glycosyltransferase family 2 protein [Elusimicrobiota bacterium]
MPDISIIIAAYNVQREIDVLLESLCRSRFRDFEICLCDDASSDDTRRTVERYRDRLAIKLTVNPSNRGVTYSRNAALALAQRPLLLFLDADVRLSPDTIDRLWAAMERTRADVVVGGYGSTALDPGIFSDYYALFVSQSFHVAHGPVPYNVFNAWCALCRREVMSVTGGHVVVPKGVEIENESLGRRIVAAGFSLVLDPAIQVDHFWGGHRKLFFIFTSRIYWWVKIFLATRCRFEIALTNSSYGFGTVCFPLAAAFGVLAFSVDPWFWIASAAAGAFFVRAYAPFYGFVFRRRPLFVPMSVLLSAYFSFMITACAAYSFIEEVVRLVFARRGTLDPALFR